MPVYSNNSWIRMFCCPYLFCLQNYDHPFPTQFWKGQNKELVSRIGDELDASQVTVSFVCVSHSVMSDLMDCSSPGSSIYGILQARILEWVAIPFSRGSSWPRNRTWVSRIAGRFFTIWATSEVQLCRGVGEIAGLGSDNGSLSNNIRLAL